MSYQPPLDSILLAMQIAGRIGSGWYNDLSLDDARTILGEAGRFAQKRFAPVNRAGDLHPVRLVDGAVVTPPGFVEAYADWCAGGWNGLTGSPSYGGQGLPMVMAAATSEMWNAACLSLSLCPLLTTGAIEAITAHASDDLKQAYLPHLISGAWPGTMNLTEPQSGSDLSQLRCMARRQDDGTYRIHGTKIFITFGDHDMTSNIIHLVLARLEGAPTGTRGISLFLVPKVLPDGTYNDLRCHGLERKLGIHGSPTCTMIYGDNGGATGWLIGEENRGLNCMFTMMNSERLLVGVQGAALADRAMQAAVAYAKERRQGRAPNAADASSTIVDHPDVKRMLLDMRVKTAAARMLCMATASAIDESRMADTETARKLADARASLLTPLAKSYATDVAVAVTSAAIQVFGGMGFIEETGVAQHYRDARILPIYEGTNGIQAIDLVTRKLGIANGAVVGDELAACQRSISRLAGDAAGGAVISATRSLTDKLNTNRGNAEALATAKPVLDLLAAVVAARYLADAAELAAPDSEAVNDARYYIATELKSALAIAQGADGAAGLVLAAKF